LGSATASQRTAFPSATVHTCARFDPEALEALQPAAEEALEAVAPAMRAALEGRGRLIPLDLGMEQLEDDR
jgi:hypothetical protein